MSAKLLSLFYMDKFPNRIRHFRKLNGWTLEKVALDLETSITQLSHLEKGGRKLNQDWMRRLADLFGITPGELLPENENLFILDEDERNMIFRYRAASETARETFTRVADAILPYNAGPREKDQDHQQAA